MYRIAQAPEIKIPILVSVPHAGTKIPGEIRTLMAPGRADQPEDTDWFVDQLYSFVPELGGTLITAELSRYVVDLNRYPDSKALYSDKRKITGVIPEETFAGAQIYQDVAIVRNEQHIAHRLDCYYRPYHARVTALLQEIKNKFGYAIILDGHSIKREVPSLSSTPFPDLILGTANGNAAQKELIDAAKECLEQSPYQFTVDQPFAGGAITRSFGQPQQGIHALQLETSQDIYMDADANQWRDAKAEPFIEFLKGLVGKLATTKLGA